MSARNTLAEALAAAHGLEGAAAACIPGQDALAARLLQGAQVIRELHGMVHREHAIERREIDARKQAQSIAARERVREYEEGDWS